MLNSNKKKETKKSRLFVLRHFENDLEDDDKDHLDEDDEEDYYYYS